MDTIFGINPTVLDISLKCIYNEIENSQHATIQKSKENNKFSTIELYVPDEIVNSVKEEKDDSFLTEDSLLLKEIEKMLMYRKNKIVLKISYEDDIGLLYKNSFDMRVGKNFLALIEKDVPFDILNNFFKEKKDYISFRKVINGSIKEDYCKLCKLIFFNNSFYSLVDNNENDFVFFEKKVEEHGNTK